MVGTPATPWSTLRRAKPSTPGGPKPREEKILVTVRMRPLSQREKAMDDMIAWGCFDDQTIVLNNRNQERATSSYTFDKVFVPTCSTQKVYEEGAKDVALSALSGMNATIFAYGQTSSGKTFTMRGITEKAISDIYEHLKKIPERDFILKLSALEIYNETVTDLLNRESGTLRLLDDAEKGTIVEKLVEEMVRDDQHLRQLIGICEAQRQVGETALNDKSSRSHQITKLTIESSLRERSGCVKSFIASLYLVDLAGSERASQTYTNGTRLKEGSHINRSLLTLTTVIRKLSGGKRSHVPYRDSKLTRILQHSIGGNARTAIICTMSPALNHVEQTRNTLLFATSAREVTNSAQVNMMEVARLEAKFRSPEPSSSCLKSLLVEKDLKIQQMERELEELKRQRDLAEQLLENERKSFKIQKGSDHYGPCSHVARCLSFSGDGEFEFAKRTSESRRRKFAGGQQALRKSVASTDPSVLVNEIRKLEQRQRQLNEEANRALEVLHRDIASHRLGNKETAETIANLLSEIKDMQAVTCASEEILTGDKANLMEEIIRLNSQGSVIASLERKLENVQKSIDQLVSSLPSSEETPVTKSQLKRKKISPFSLGNSANVQSTIRSPFSPLSSYCKVRPQEIENKPPEDALPSGDNTSGPCEGTPPKSNEISNSISSRNGTPSGRKSNSVNVKKVQRMFQNAAEQNIKSIRAYVTELKERVAKLQYQKQLLVCQVLELEANDAAVEETDMKAETPVPWHVIFEEQRKQIVMLWHLCHVSLIHRTQFYLLFQGDPSDKIYLEVELKRLTWLEQHLSDLGNASPALLGDEPAGSVAASIKALRQEREYLAKRANSKLTAEEREILYAKWEIPPVGKQRRLQFVNKLWTDPYDTQHIQGSAEIVAKLVGFCESGEHVSKEMFELNFVPTFDKKTWMGWNLISNLLKL